MSYTFTVRTENGVSTVTSETAVPDGEHQVSGHEDPGRRDLSVTRRAPDGRFVASVSHSHSKEG